LQRDIAKIGSQDVGSNDADQEWSASCGVSDETQAKTAADSTLLYTTLPPP